MNNLKVRKATVEDAKQIKQIFQSVYTDIFPYTKEKNIIRDLKQPQFYSIIAEVSQQVIGFGQLRPPEYPIFQNESHALEISRLAVYRNYQKRRIGKAIAQHLYHKLEKLKPDIITIDYQTITNHSQKLLSFINCKPTALLKGLLPGFMSGRTPISILLGVRYQNTRSHNLPIYIQNKYQHFIRAICQFWDRHPFFEKSYNSSQTNIPQAFENQIKEHLKTWEKENAIGSFHYGMIPINVNDPNAIHLIDFASKHGLEIEGFIPFLKNAENQYQDTVIMRKVPDKLDYSLIQITPSDNQLFLHSW
ncbi:MAG: GNAT family N-acetyltransferase [Spirochaetes bacterium]|nr:GNAT family N-acetyltransferase [Spirochaetota bacterium]